MRVVNFSHPLTTANLAEIETLTGMPVREVIDVPSQIDPRLPLEPQVEAMLDGMGFTPSQWQTEPLLFNLPSLSNSAAVLLAELHGRMGCFPTVIRLRPEPQIMVPRFVVAEILNLQAVRERARSKRFRPNQGAGGSSLEEPD